jgi:hypothetical protein
MHSHLWLGLIGVFSNVAGGASASPGILETSLTSREHGAPSRKVCCVPASGTNTTDDAPAIMEAFKECGHGGKVLFENTTYYVNTVMNVSGLNNCEIDLQGTLVVCILRPPNSV